MNLDVDVRWQDVRIAAVDDDAPEDSLPELPVQMFDGFGNEDLDRLLTTMVDRLHYLAKCRLAAARHELKAIAVAPADETNVKSKNLRAIAEDAVECDVACADAILDAWRELASADQFQEIDIISLSSAMWALGSLFERLRVRRFEQFVATAREQSSHGKKGREITLAKKHAEMEAETDELQPLINVLVLTKGLSYSAAVQRVAERLDKSLGRVKSRTRNPKPRAQKLHSTGVHS